MKNVNKTENNLIHITVILMGANRKNQKRWQVNVQKRDGPLESGTAGMVLFMHDFAVSQVWQTI
jgi:hypothetical protein